MLDAALTIVGQQGPFRGGATMRGREGTIAVLSVTHSLHVPRDGATGQATGKRVHAPIVITKEIDRSTPLLLNALTRNEKLTTWRLDVYGTDAAGRQTVSYCIELTHPLVASVTLLPDLELGPAGGSPVRPPREAVGFVYERIKWTWLDAKVSTIDDWITPT